MHFPWIPERRRKTTESLVFVEPLQSNVWVSAIKRDLVKSFPHENDSMPFNSPRTYFPICGGWLWTQIYAFVLFFLLVAPSSDLTNWRRPLVVVVNSHTRNRGPKHSLPIIFILIRKEKVLTSSSNGGLHCVFVCSPSERRCVTVPRDWFNVLWLLILFSWP